MALKRKMLEAMGIEAEKIDQIIEAHTETVNALKDERDQFKENAEKLEKVQKDLNKANEKIKTYEEKGEVVSKKDYDDLKTQFDTYKNDITAKETQQAKETAYMELLRESGVSEKRLKAVLRISDLDSVEIGEDGKIKDADKHTENIKKEFSDYIEEHRDTGADTPNPPDSEGGEKDPFLVGFDEG